MSMCLLFVSLIEADTRQDFSSVGVSQLLPSRARAAR
jgi:hypothetical protein